MHIRKSTLIDYIENSLIPKDREKCDTHLRSCPECSVKLRILQTVIAPSEKEMRSPSRKTLHRILSRYQGEDSLFSFRQFVHRHAFPIASAAAIIIIAGALSLYFPVDHSHIHASRVKGDVSANEKKIARGKMISSGSRLTTGNNSRLFLEALAMRLRAGSKTSLVVEKAQIDPLNKKAEYAFVIDKGTVSAEFDRNADLLYTLTTPHAVITSKGAHIILEVDKGQTRIQIKSGNAVLEPSSGDSIEVNEGFSYIISEATTDDDSSIEKSEIIPTDLPAELFD
ncbi:MAG TPA: hypothetical protein VF857_06870 [Spirochaetota bacterium]